ncbi:ATP-binding cassette domain-containing protein [bacterium]|nr:ATP-binding cassette domain-containing protein [bacterium]
MIQLKDAWFRAGGHTILQGINLNVNLGEFIGIVGVSGAGKSTLLRLVHMEIRPTRGIVLVDNLNSATAEPDDIAIHRRKVGYIFQDFKLLEDRDVYANVAFALWATGVKRKRIKKRVFQVLAEVGLSHKRYAMIPRLSGGEQQRVAIARALANEPFILLADEPTGNLDPDNTREIMGLLQRINRKGTAVLMATHKAELVKGLASQIMQIHDGRISG